MCAMKNKLCKNCCLKFMRALDEFFKVNGYEGIDGRKCTRIKRNQGAECYQNIVDYLSCFIVPRKDSPKCYQSDHKSCMHFRQSLSPSVDIFTVFAIKAEGDNEVA